MISILFKQSNFEEWNSRLQEIHRLQFSALTQITDFFRYFQTLYRKKKKYFLQIQLLYTYNSCPNYLNQFSKPFPDSFYRLFRRKFTKCIERNKASRLFRKIYQRRLILEFLVFERRFIINSFISRMFFGFGKYLNVSLFTSGAVIFILFRNLPCFQT